MEVLLNIDVAWLRATGNDVRCKGSPVASNQATAGEGYQNQVYVLPKQLCEKVVRLHLERIGVKLTELTHEQAHYLARPL